MSLAGKRVINTRAVHQATALDDLLRQEGAIPLSYPAIAILPPLDTRPLDEAIKGISVRTFDLLVLTSANAVYSIAARAQILGISLKNMPTAAVGKATAETAREKLGAAIEIISDEQNAQALANALKPMPGTRVLLSQAENARPTLRQKLAERGAMVTEVVAYRTIRGSGGVELAPMLNNGQVNAVTFTSAAAVGFWVERLHDEGTTRFDGVCAACLSERIGHAAREHGFGSVVAARRQTLEGLVAALANHYAS